MLDQVVAIEAPVNGAGHAVSVPEPEPHAPHASGGRAEWEAGLRAWLGKFFAETRAPSDAEVKTILAANFKRQHRFIGYAADERYEVQVVEPDIKDPKLKYEKQSNKFAYTDTLGGGCKLLYEAGREFAYQGLYIIPQVVNPAALSKAAPDCWNMPAKGAGTDAKDILAFLVSYADFDTVREGNAKKVSATHDEMMVSCERGIQFYLDAAEILGSPAALGLVFSGNGCQAHVALDRLPHDPKDGSKHCPVQKLREEFVHVVNILYSDERVVGDDTVCNPNRLCPAAGTAKRKGYNDTKLGRVHRLTGIYCAENVERLSLDRFRHLVETLRARLTDQQREALAGKTKKPVNGVATTARPATSTGPTTPSTKTGPSPYDLANAIPIREVYSKLGHDPEHPKCPNPACAASDTTEFLDDKLGVQSLKCLHNTCGQKSWKNIDLVVALRLGKSLDDKNARREAVTWIAEQFPERNIPKPGKTKAAAKAEVDALIAATPSYLDDSIETSTPDSTNDVLRPIVEAIQTRDLAPQAALIKKLSDKTGISKTALFKLTKADGEASVVAPTDFSDADWPTKLQRSKKGVALSTFANAVTVVAHDPRWANRFAWCDFSNRIVLRAAPPWPAESACSVKFEPGTPWAECDDHRLVDYLERHYGVSVTPKEAYHAALLAAEKRHVHPVRDYLDSLTWDGTVRLDRVLPVYFGAKESTYTKLVGPWTFMQAVKRIYEPGCQADYVPVLEGEQGIQKSSAIRALCPSPAWVSDTMFTIGSKDAMVALRGRWFIELAEAMSLLRAEHAASKAFFTSRTDDYRPPYGAHNVQIPRQCMFFCTINPEGGYLRDPTGGRRYWPIACGEAGAINIAAIEADRDQLWAEAVARYRKGERCYPHADDEHALFGEEQGEREEQDPWHETIRAGIADLNEVTVAFILASVLSIEAAKQESKHQSRVVKVLTSDGWRLRGVGKAPETDPVKIAEGKKRKSIKVYARKEHVDNAVEFTPGMTSADLTALRNARGSAKEPAPPHDPNDLLDNV